MEHGVARRIVSSVTACICLALYAGGCASPGAGNLREDESALQGRWEQQAMEGVGEKGQRVVKEVKGDTETVTTYDQGEKVIHAQTAKFRLRREGPVRVYTFYNRRVTAGPEQGRFRDSERSYLYKLRGDELHEVWGLLEGQEGREVAIIRWKRAG